MTFIAREEPFVCEHCGLSVTPIEHGSYRNHCPKCLYSKHVDRDGPGDRLSACKGLQKPVAIDLDGKKGFVIVYECTKCGKNSRNKAAIDDNIIGFSEELQQNRL
jgi:DNA-directed RNA polymerase subunit RPC12/RpoP